MEKLGLPQIVPHEGPLLIDNSDQLKGCQVEDFLQQFTGSDRRGEDESKPEGPLLIDHSHQLMESQMMSGHSWKKKSIKEHEEELLLLGKFEKSSRGKQQFVELFGCDIDFNQCALPSGGINCSAIYAFDIQDFPGPSPYTSIVPLTHINVDRDAHNLVVGYAKLAITNYNKENGKAYKFMALVKVNRGIAGDGFMYYITFTATDGSGDLEFFEAKVWYTCGQDPEVGLCRLKHKYDAELN